MKEHALRPDPVLLGQEWEAIVTEEYEQVEAVREWHDQDHYQSCTEHFIDDPYRTNEEILNRLREFGDASSTWLDIGAGGGRYALPLALSSQKVIAVDPSPAQIETLRKEVDKHQLTNVETHNLRWPEGSDQISADFSLMAHVGYDIRNINAFLDGAEQSTRERCIMLMMDRPPSGGFTQLWEAVHGHPRQQLPSAKELTMLLLARGTMPEIERFSRESGPWDEQRLRENARTRLWLVEGSEKDQRLQRILDEQIASGITDYQQPSAIMLIHWTPSG